MLNPVEPVLPLETRNVTVAGMTLRGIGFRGGSYTDQANIVPLTSAPATEIRGIHFPFRAQAFYPVRAWDANYFDALSQPSGGITKLVVMPAQFKANNLTDIEATLRKYSDMDFRLFYSDNVASYPEVQHTRPGRAPRDRTGDVDHRHEYRHLHGTRDQRSIGRRPGGLGDLHRSKWAVLRRLAVARSHPGRAATRPCGQESCPCRLARPGTMCASPSKRSMASAWLHWSPTSATTSFLASTQGRRPRRHSPPV